LAGTELMSRAPLRPERLGDQLGVHVLADLLDESILESNVPFHHRLIHRGEWEVRIVNRFPVFIPPSYVDAKREPIPGGYHRRQ
jgi:hypothetical protein